MKRKGLDYLAIADLPPPTQGISIVSLWVVQFLRENRARVELCNTSAKPGFFYTFRRCLRFLIALQKVLKSNRRTAIYIALSHGPSLYAQTIIVLLSKWKKHRIILHHHTFLPINSPKKLQNRICHGTMRKRVEHIFLSKYMKEKYEDIWHPTGNRWVVTNHQIAALRTKSQIDGNKLKEGIKLCFAGRMSQEKGFWDCESVTRLLLTENLGIKAVFLGPIFHVEIFKAIENLKQDFPLRFEHIGQYDESILTRSLQDSSYFLFPSHYSNEASPLVVLEAQSLGNICITSNVGTLSTDVLSPGLAVDIKNWHKTVLEIVQLKRFNHLNLKLATDRIREKSNILALECDKQMKEVFRL